MTLRLRLAVWFGVVVAVGIGAASVLAYLNTAAELEAATDEFLETRARDFAEGVRLLPQDGGDGRGGRDRGRNDDNDPGVADVADGFSTDPDSVVQVIDASGAVVSAGPLPIDATDLRLAERDDKPVLRDITFDGVDYRLITQHIPGADQAVQIARATGEIDTVLTTLRTRLALIAVATTVLAAAVGWFVAARATRPLRRLSNVAEQIAATQDLATPVPAGGRDEVGRLAESLDQMIDALATSRDQQQRLVMDAGHELRTPLTSLRANVELLDRAPDLDPESKAALLGGITSEVEELSELVTELVELATDTRDDDHPDEPVDLLDVVEGAVRRLRRRAEREVQVDGDSTIVVGRAPLLDRAVGNLLGNAHKFSPAGAPIEVTVGAGSVRVRDHGPGIPDDDLGRVFDRFYRSTPTRTMPGSGLGLAIVAQIVDRHGGRTHAANHPSGGAVVGFDLPEQPG